MKIVSDTGPIIGLAKIGRIFLLKDLAAEVLIPPFVHRELYGEIGTEFAGFGLEPQLSSTYWPCLQ